MFIYSFQIFIIKIDYNALQVKCSSGQLSNYVCTPISYAALQNSRLRIK